MKTVGNFKYLIIVLACLILIYMLFFVKNSSFDTRSLQEFWNLGHIPLFVLAGYFMYRLDHSLQHQNLLIQALKLVLMGFLLGLSIEFLQSLVGRQASLHDVMLDVIGAILSLLFFSKRFSRSGLYFKISVSIVVVSLLVSVSWRLVISLLDEYNAY